MTPLHSLLTVYGDSVQKKYEVYTEYNTLFHLFTLLIGM